MRTFFGLDRPAGRSLRRPRPARRTARRLRLESLEARRLLAVDPILEWNAVALEVNRVSYSGAVVNDQIGPTRSSRALAIVHAAMFDAWNSIHGDYTPYLTAIPESSSASDEAAVAQAAHDTLAELYPHQQAFIDEALAQTLERVPDGVEETLGVEVGKLVAQNILEHRAGDGSEIAGEYVPDGQMGRHDIDPLNPNQGFLTPAWGDVTTFVMASAGDLEVPPPPALDSAEYAAAYEQVKRLGEEQSAERTVDQTEIGIYWGYDVARGLGDPPRLYNQIVRVIAEQQENTAGENARLFALVNLAMADAGCVSWGVKYRDAFWRPIVAIRNGESDGNPDTAGDPDWSPLGAPRTNPLPEEDVNFTPPFPAYTSGHATFGGAAFKTLANFYQTDDIHFSIPFDFISDEFNGVSRDIREAIPELILDHVRQIRPRHFESFSQAAAENAASRIFLGIHWRFDATEGVRAGNAIADYAFDHLMRPIAEPGPTHVPSVDFERQIDAYLDGTYTTFFQPDDAVLDWNGVALEAMRKDSLRDAPDVKGPTEGSLALAYVHTAIYDAVNAIQPTHTRYAYPDRDFDAQVEAAVAAAAHRMLAHLFPSQETDLDAALETYLNEIPDGAAETAGVAVGRGAAGALLGLREDDGRDIDMSHTPVNEMGHHQVDPLHPDQGFLSPKWGKILPFAMHSGDQFRAPSPPALTSQEYAEAYEEVMIVGAADAEISDRDNNGLPDRTPDQTEIGLFWAYDGSPNLSTPPRLYNQIVRTIAKQQGNTLAENARLFALVNLAMADAGIASWETKYKYDFWRPVVAIRNGHLDGNPDTPGETDWRPLGAPASNTGDPEGDFTPPFPAYTSGHATFGGAVFRTLERFYGTDEIAFSFQSDELNGVTRGSNGEVRPAAPRRFESLRQAMEENAESRIYLGIHWRFDAELGMEQGSAIADYVFDHKFRPLTAFQNGERAADVNGDGQLNISDVLFQVEQLRHVVVNGAVDPTLQGFFDVNGDERVTLGDLLAVVEVMRNAAGSSEAASSSGDSSAGSPNEAEGEADAAVQVAVADWDRGRLALIDAHSAEEDANPVAADPTEDDSTSDAVSAFQDERHVIDQVWKDGGIFDEDLLADDERKEDPKDDEWSILAADA